MPTGNSNPRNHIWHDQSEQKRKRDIIFDMSAKNGLKVEGSLGLNGCMHNLQ